MNEDLDYREFEKIRGIWNAITNGNLQSIATYEVTSDDLKMMEGLFRFKREMKREKINFIYRVVSIEDIDKLKEYLDYFGVENGFEDDNPFFTYLLRVNNCFDEIDDYITYIVKEKLTCIDCGMQLDEWRKICESCIKKRQFKSWMPTI